MKIEIISGGEYGVEQGALAAAWSLDTPTKGYIRKGYLTSQGPCEKVKWLGVTELDSDRLRDCAQKCIDECNGVLILRSGECSKIEDNIKQLVGDKRPLMEFDFLNPTNLRLVTTWLIAEGITKLYVTGRNDSSSLNIFYNKTLQLMNHVIKDMNSDLERKELDNKRKSKAEVKK